METNKKFISQGYFPSFCWTLMYPEMDPATLILGDFAKKRPHRVPPRSILALKCVLEPCIGGCVSKKPQIYCLAYTESQYIAFLKNQLEKSQFLKKNWLMNFWKKSNWKKLISNFFGKIELKNNRLLNIEIEKSKIAQAYFS